MRMTYFSRDLAVRAATAYLKAAREGDQLDAENLSRLAVMEKGLVEEFLRKNGLEGSVTRSKRVRAALIAILSGAEGERIARHLDWREFEELSAELFVRAGYTVFLDCRIGKGRRSRQIDMAAMFENTLLVIDCKHWVRPPSYLERRRLMSMQEERISLLASLTGDREIRIIPAVLTLYEPRELIVDGCPYVPIGRISGFMDWFMSSYHSVRHVKAKISLKKLEESARAVMPRGIPDWSRAGPVEEP